MWLIPDKNEPVLKFEDWLKWTFRYLIYLAACGAIGYAIAWCFVLLIWILK